MSIIKKMRKQTAVYWPFSSIDQFGKKSFGDPVLIKVRWVDISEEFLDADGERQMSNAVVYVDRDVTIGGVLMLGVLADITDAVNIKENVGAWEIRRFENLPNMRATEFLKTVML